ncbi:hypothetical protein GCM10011351_06200 [Paraliobacillus quinghaiensis]|uniref:YpoC-like domain-containing protein n=1 Tax=Paraliobacillus quinghaiensis TaxID=470815 RepID=A0A917WQG1_9BACI|nr:hypothetical protein [Paraliobacillus quinghaiensis]GGM23093.1 hypothetical protein GCM10011351_06200 [Paraliobacillus quinghaiensis]
MQTDGKMLIEDWKKQSAIIAELFHQKAYQEARVPMEKYTKQFIHTLFILNKKEWLEGEDFLDNIQTFKYKPLNIKERIQYVIEYPHQYHCFIQLNELYKEVEKIYARAEILEKK